jgi:hypothetical protein
MCNKSIICGVLFDSGAITFYEGNNMLSALFVKGNNMLSALAKYVTEFEPRSWQGVLDTTLCDKVCQ